MAQVAPGTVEALADLARHAAAGGAPPELVDWFEAGLAGYVWESIPLEQALALDGVQGGRRAVTRHRLAVRDSALRAAHRLLRRPGDSTNRIALELLRAIRRFESGPWKDHREDAQPPARLTPIQQCLWQAAKTGLPFPGARQLRSILGNERPMDVANSSADDEPTRNE